jgi:hypothetical protein
LAPDFFAGLFLAAVVIVVIATFAGLQLVYNGARSLAHKHPFAATSGATATISAAVTSAAESGKKAKAKW